MMRKVLGTLKKKKKKNRKSAAAKERGCGY